jgi:hypothetical protein
MQSTSLAASWQALALSYRRRVNFGWWLQSFIPWFVGAGLIGCAVILWLRAQGFSWAWYWSLGTAALVLLPLAVVTWKKSEVRYISTEDSLVSLEAKLRLNNALTSAAAGVRSWPDLPEQTKSVQPVWQWWRWMALPKLGVLACLLTAFFLPIAGPDLTAEAKVPPPSAVTQAEKMLEQLAQDKVAREEDLEKFQEQLDALKDKPVEEWYHHAGLEAADNLKESIESATGGLSKNLNQAENSLGSLLEESLEEDGQKAREEAAEQLSAAVEGMKSGALQPNENLLNQLKGLNMEQLSKGQGKEQAEALREALQKAAQACKDCKGSGKKPGQGSGKNGENGEGEESEGGGSGESLEDKLRDQLKNGAPNNGSKGQQGPGAPERGPGTVDLNLNDQASDTENGEAKKAETRDIQNLQAGDMLGTSDGQHKLDKTPLGPMTGGKAGAGDGGNATWKDELSPAEKQVLENFFK